jgi:hypothetical protein
MDAAITKLAVNGLTIIPFTIHSLFSQAPAPAVRLSAAIDHFSHHGVIANYNTKSHANLFFRKKIVAG